MNKPHKIPNPETTGFRSLWKSALNESGAALVIVLLLLLVLAGLVPAAVNMARNDFTRTVSYEESKESFYIADTGVEHAKRLMKTQYKVDFLDDGILDTGATTASKTVNGNTQTYNEYSYGGGKYWIRVDDNIEADGVTTADTDNMIIVTSVGQVDGGPEKIIKATTWKMDLPPQAFPSALTMVGPSSILNTNGAGFQVTGANTAGGTGLDINGNPDPSCPGKAAVSFESTGPVEEQDDIVCGMGPPGCTDCATDATTNTCLASNGQSQANFGNYTGVNSTSGDFEAAQTTFTADSAQDLWDLITNDADTDNTPDMVSTTGCPKGPGGSCYWPGDTTSNSVVSDTWGSPTSPVLAYVEGHMNLQSITGYGILIVDRNFTISGSFNWNGIVLVGVCPTCSSTADDAGGTGSGEINGAFVVGNGTQAQVNMSGSLSINYSCEGIGFANQIFMGSVNVVAWHEEGA